MELNNATKDMIGYMRAVNVVLTLWDIDRIKFPLDSLILTSLSNNKEKLNELLGIISEISQSTPLLNEVRSALDDIVDSSKPDFWDKEWTGAILSLYSKKRELVNFHYEDSATFNNELRPIFIDLLSQLVSSVLWLRVAYYDRFPDKNLPSAISNFLQAFNIIHSMSPKDVTLLPSHELLRFCLSSWFYSETVQSNISSLPHTKTGLHKVLNEISSMEIL